MNRQETRESSGAAGPARARRAGFSRVLCRLLPASALLTVALSACGPDPQSLGDACPDVPLYRYLFDAKTATWKRVSLSGGDAGEPLGADDLAKITAAEAHCVTPAGAATSEGTSSTPDAGAP